MILQFQSFIDNEIIKDYKISYQKDDNKIIFNDDETNDEFVIEINDKSLNISRSGDIKMKFKFILNKKTHGLYELMGNIYHFDIETTLIDIKDEYINLIYKMKDNTNKISNHKINIHFNI